MAKVSCLSVVVVVATFAVILSTFLEGTLCEDVEALRIPRFRVKLPKIKLPKIKPKLPKVPSLNVPKVELTKPNFAALKKIPVPSLTSAVSAGSEIASSAATIHMVTQSQQAAPQYQDYQ